MSRTDFSIIIWTILNFPLQLTAQLPSLHRTFELYDLHFLTSREIQTYKILYVEHTELNYNACQRQYFEKNSRIISSLKSIKIDF